MDISPGPPPPLKLELPQSTIFNKKFLKCSLPPPLKLELPQSTIFNKEFLKSSGGLQYKWSRTIVYNISEQEL